MEASQNVFRVEESLVSYCELHSAHCRPARRSASTLDFTNALNDSFP